MHYNALSGYAVCVFCNAVNKTSHALIESSCLYSHNHYHTKSEGCHELRCSCIHLIGFGSPLANTLLRVSI